MIDPASAANLCRQLAPQDLGGAPIYVLLYGQLPADLRDGHGCLGFTAHDLDLVCREVIGPAWRGRGLALAVDDGAGHGWFRAANPQGFLETLLHELAHPLAQDWRPWENAVEFSEATVRRWRQEIVAELPAPSPTDPADDGHGERFLRTALHLIYRARKLGVGLWAPGVARPAAGGPWLAKARLALGDEPRRFADQSFREILATSPPPAFLKLAM